MKRGPKSKEEALNTLAELSASGDGAGSGQGCCHHMQNRGFASASLHCLTFLEILQLIIHSKI